MARAIYIFSKYVVLPGGFAYVLMQIAKPSDEEIEKIRAYTPKQKQFSAVLEAAASPSSKPMYRQKPGEQHPVPDLAKEADTKR